MKPPFSYAFLWFSYGFPMVFPYLRWFFQSEQRGDGCQGDHDEGGAQDGIGRARRGRLDVEGEKMCRYVL